MWRSARPFGAWNNGGFILYNNEWNTSQAGPQTIWANSFANWGVASKQPDSTSVKTYPCVQLDYQNPRIGSFTLLTSTFAQSMPSTSGFDAEAAYDIWLNHYKIEVMIWVDNHGQTPSGHLLAYVMLNQQKFALWQNGSAMYSFVVSGQQETTGTVDLLSFFTWLLRHRFLRPADTMTQVNFGWEIASTGGSTLDFSVQHYSLSSSPTG